MISRMDESVGRLLALLKELHIDDNTLVVFSSDNGPPANEGGRQPEFNDSNGPLRGYKGQMYEGGIRVPFIARWPKHIKPGTTTDSRQSLSPTSCRRSPKSAAGSAPSGIDGLDFSPDACSAATSQKLADRMLYWEFGKYGVYSQGRSLEQLESRSRPRHEEDRSCTTCRPIWAKRNNLAAEQPDLVTKFNRLSLLRLRSDSPTWPLVSTEKPPTANKNPTE